MFEILVNGGIASPKGFLCQGGCCGLKPSGNKDLGIVYSEMPTVTFGVFTKNKFQAAPVLKSIEVLNASCDIRAVVVNSGNANACTGDEGLKNSHKMVADTESALGLDAGKVLVCSTGIIGQQLDIVKISSRIPELVKSLGEYSQNFAESIMTTDTVSKSIAVTLSLSGTTVTIGGSSKGSGMIHPNMATMLGFISTDILLPESYQTTYQQAIEMSFNSISVDGDMSTNDTCFLMSNEGSGLRYENLSKEDQSAFDEALAYVSQTLAKKIVRDGEGATKMVEISVINAPSWEMGRDVGRFVANSKLVKTAIFGQDPNWGRVIASLGAASELVEPALVDIKYAGVPIVGSGMPLPTDIEELNSKVQAKEFSIEIDLKLGKEKAVVWTTDLSYDYVRINAEYTT